jgi:hypothetical protein
MPVLVRLLNPDTRLPPTRSLATCAQCTTHTYTDIQRAPLPHARNAKHTPMQTSNALPCHMRTMQHTPIQTGNALLPHNLGQHAPHAVLVLALRRDLELGLERVQRQRKRPVEDPWHENGTRNMRMTVHESFSATHSKTFEQATRYFRV